MSNIFLVDTSVWIEGLKKGGNRQAQEWLKTALLQESVVMAPPIKAEILAGARDETQLNQLKDQLAALPILERDPEVWEQTGWLAFTLRRRGANIPIVDVLIASWALVHGCTLAHHDHHYEMIKKVEANLATLSIPAPLR